MGSDDADVTASDGHLKGRVIVLWRGCRCDVTDFLHKHPGGAKILECVNGLDIEDIMNGQGQVNGYLKKHSKNAYRILVQYAIDPLPDDSLISDIVREIDYSKPIMEQVGRLGEYYWTWIHQPIDTDLRMFHSDFCEFFSRTSWYMIPILWLPVVIGLTLYSYYYQLISGAGYWLAVLLLLVQFSVGVVVWSLMEYVFHRYCFHWKPPPDSPNLIWLHFMLHGMHHKAPLDKGRLVFPPIVALLLVLIVFSLYSYLVPFAYCYSIAAGNLFGYVFYDLTHFYMHHGLPASGSWLYKMKKYHHDHHFSNPDKGFGISSVGYLWDVAFGTLITMYLMYYRDADGNRVYTLKKEDPQEKPTFSAHPARFSPEDKYSRHRLTIKKRFGLLLTSQPKPQY